MCNTIYGIAAAGNHPDIKPTKLIILFLQTTINFVFSFLWTNFAVMDKTATYRLLVKQVESLIEGENNPTGQLANAAAMIHETFGFWWTGFYLVGEVVGVLCDEQYLAADGKPDVEKMDIITYDPVHFNYIQLGKVVGKAFADGKNLK